jgi:hypothetical protein
MVLAQMGEDALTAVEGRIADLMGVMNAVTAELVEVIAEVDRTGLWQGWGIRSLEHWVTWRCGVSPRRARGLVALARRLPELPEVAAVFAAGSLTEDQAAVVCRHTTPPTDAQVAELAPLMTEPQLRRALASIPQPPPEPVAEERPAMESPSDPVPTGPHRYVRFGWADDGSWRLSAILPADEGSVVDRAIHVAFERELRDRHPDLDHLEVHAAAAARDQITWADALGRLASDGLNGLECAHDVCAGRPPGERFQVFVHVDADAGPDRPIAMHLGPLLPAGVDGFVTCDATVRAVLRGEGRPIGFGRRRRTVPPRLRVLIEARDGGCRVPGCGHRRRLHVHHLRHWRDGGPTDPDNLVALCPRHHRLLHFGRLRISGDPADPDGLVFSDERGRVLDPARASPIEGAARDAAAERDVPMPTYENPIGEPLQGRWLTWN